MAATILVAYGTRAGSTGEVAEAIGKVLRDAGLDVDVQRLPLKGYPARYDGVVLGAPFYMFRWHKEALRFLRRYRAILERLPVAVFALGPFNDVEKEWNDVAGQLERALLEFPWLHPVSTKIVGGKFDPAGLRFPYNIVPGLKKMPVTDIRNWNHIHEWAQELAGIFRPDED